MKNRLTFLLILVSIIGGIFAYRHYSLKDNKPYPSIEDRLPEAMVIGKINVLDFAEDLKPFLFNNRIRYRDFIASDFILSQTKNSGINLQKPVYFYFTEDDEFGALISVSDSSKVPKAVTRIHSFFEVTDTIVNGSVIHKIPELNTYFCYERNWFFVYRGNQFIKNYLHVKFSDHTSLKKSWKRFLEDEHYKSQNIAFYMRPKALIKERLDYAAATLSFDSNYVYLQSIIADEVYFPMQLKTGGHNLMTDTSVAKHYVNFHLDVDSLRALDKHFIYKFLDPYVRKYNFPFRDFIQAWNGDLSVHIGGKTKVKETYIESEFDDDFNEVEVTKTQVVERDLFSYVMTTTPTYKDFVDQLFVKGFLRRYNDDYFFLASPPVQLITRPDIFYIYTGVVPRVDSIQIPSGGRIQYENNDFYFKIDSTSKKEMYFNLTIPFDYLNQKYKLTRTR